jgi:hypothetical protein
VVHTWAPFMNLIIRLIPSGSRSCIRHVSQRKKARSYGGVRFDSNPASPSAQTVPSTPLGGRVAACPLTTPSTPLYAIPLQPGASSIPGSPSGGQQNHRLGTKTQAPLLLHGNGCQLPELAAKAAEEAIFGLAFDRRAAMMGRQQRLQMRKAQRDALRSGDVTKVTCLCLIAPEDASSAISYIFSVVR